MAESRETLAANPTAPGLADAINTYQGILDKMEADRVTYTIVPLSNRVAEHIAGSHGPDDLGGLRFDLAGFGLKKIEGLFEDDKKPFTLIFENRKIGNRTEKRLTDECLDRLPLALLREIEAKVNEASTMNPGEVAELKNLPGSSEPKASESVSTATETKSDAPSLAVIPGGEPASGMNS